MRPPQYPNDEDRIIRAFVRHLEREGWSVVLARPSVNEPDIIATRGRDRLVAEAKGRTAAPRTDVDTMYGQLLRRIAGDASTSYAAVVPTSFISRALDVHAEIRAVLRLQVFEVTDDNTVIEHA
jgi:hypothetical protein